MSTHSVHIIGGGIIGLCSGYYLNKAGYEVTIIDSSDMCDGTSHGNAGMIVPSHFVPLAAPGVMAKGIRWMFDSKSPFYIKPRINYELFQWLWRFYRSCNKQHVTDSVHLLKDYNELSKALYKEMSKEMGNEVDYQENGLLMLCNTSKAMSEEIESATLAMDIGLQAEILSEDQVQKKNPLTKVNVHGGVWYPGDAQVYSNRFMTLLSDNLINQGVRVLANCTVTNFKTSAGRVKELLTSSEGKIPVNQIVISAGVWTKHLLQKIGVKSLLQDGKGYSITLPYANSRPSIPSILSEAKVAMTPMGKDLRITGTLEISNLSPRINLKRIQGFLEAVPQYFPSIKPDPNPTKDKIWTGYRPCSPDGIPYMGRTTKYSNVIVATGHAMMGMSLGPASGMLVEEIVTDKKPSIPLDQMHPERF